ncbi:MAG TPA: two-component regulator propeller domain-containing protein [Lentimicrobium sp.]|nr:two-component regulator propeller domain-containing protein [Lentimicrobium sp.]
MRIITSALLFLILSFICALNSKSQEIGIGHWRDHLPYSKVISVTYAENRIYAATPYSLFYLDLNDNSLNRVTKISGLSDVGISSIEYSKEYNTLVVAYSNANIDLIKDDEVINLSDIKRKPILGDKSIYNIDLIEDRAFLSCGFGVVVLDIQKAEFPEPIYYIGPEGSAVNVFDITFNPGDSLIYAATATGIYSSNYYTSNLANFAEWKREVAPALPAGPFNRIAAFHNRIYVNRSGPNYADDHMFIKTGGNWDVFDQQNTSDRYSIEVHNDMLLMSMNLALDVYNADGTIKYRIWTYSPEIVQPLDAMSFEDNVIWIADQEQGLTKVTNQYGDEHFILNGPDFPDAFALSAAKNDVWVVPGGRNLSFEPLYREARFAGFVNGTWKTVDDEQDSFLSDYRDAFSVAVNPNNPKNVFIGTMGYGLLEYTDGVFTARYTPENSSLQTHVSAPSRVDVTGLIFDSDNNLWVVNSSASSLLSRKTPAGEWRSYSLGSSASGVDVDKIVIDFDNQKWLLGRNLNLYVFNDNNTPDNPSDDKTKRLSSAAGNGALPGAFVRSIAVDREGLVWLGTDKGVAVFYSPQNVFAGQNFDAQKVLIEQDGYGQYLLETETVTAIAIDGSNRKWFGTDRAGLFLMSDDGTKQIAHFTEENSPLLSNSITALTLTEEGELFIATTKGIISYRSEAVPPKETLSEVQVFPNPVYSNFTGNIAIRGLVENSTVKITDVAGNLVYSTEAQGGQAIWNGYNFDGKKATTGVYLVFISNSDGSKTEVTKIMIIN